MKKKNLIAGIILIFSLLILYYVLKGIGFSKIGDSMREIQTSFYIIVVFFLYLIILMLYNFRWELVASDLMEVKFLKLMPITLVGFFLNTITPSAGAGGEPVAAYYLSRMTKKDEAECFSTILLGKTMELLTFTILAIIALIGLLFLFDVPNSIIVMMVIGIILLSAITVAIIYIEIGIPLKVINYELRAILKRIYYIPFLVVLRHRFHSLQKFDSYVITRFDEFIKDSIKTIKDRKLVRNLVFVEIAIWGLMYVKTYLLFMSFGVTAPIHIVFIVVTVSILAGYIAFVPGGFGIVESVMIVLYAPLQMDNIAAAVTIIDRGLFYLIVIGLGYGSLVYLNFKYK